MWIVKVWVTSAGGYFGRVDMWEPVKAEGSAFPQVFTSEGAANEVRDKLLREGKHAKTCAVVSTAARVSED